MTIDRLKEARDAVPFRPFVIRLSDGRKVRVGRNDALWFPPKSRRTVILAQAGKESSPLDPRMITSLRFTDGKKAPTKPRRRGH
jgi:hypothetical protein